MFEPSDAPRVFGVPLGVDFPRALVDGLLERHKRSPPEALARVQLIVNTRRMARRIRTLFDTGPALLLPQIQLVTDLGEHWDLAHIPDATPPLRRRLELVRLLSALLERAPRLAPRSSLYDLADSLAALMDEMHGEGVAPDAIDRLDISDQSGHWERVKAFLSIVRHYFESSTNDPDTEARQRLVVEHTIRRWRLQPPDHPVIVAGSTGSRGATQLLMQAVAELPLGAVILPGFDFDMPEHVWTTLAGDTRGVQGALPIEDHPQYRFCKFASELGMNPGRIPRWSDAKPANEPRNRLISLALRPAPVTDQWLTDGPALDRIDSAMQDVTLLEAPTPRQEALAIAMRLREAAENGQSAALITPDRTLTRQVTAALDRWDILPDDSAGTPLHLSPPGRFLRHVGDLFRQRLSAELLLTLLKHPLTHSGADRGTHLLLSRELELHLRRHGPPFPGADDLKAWGERRKEEMAPAWIGWLCDCFTERQIAGDVPLETRVAQHLTLAERIAQGCREAGTGQLWEGDAGREARKATTELLQESSYGGSINSSDYSSLFHSLLSRQEVRNPTDPHPNILIWGTLEARVQGADLLILAGLNEGSWPMVPAPDPWLNRNLRHDAGLMLPERRIGLSAHDFQQAAAAPEVWLSRSVRSDDAETIVSRWVNRLQNLLKGLPEQGGAAALEQMQARGDRWLEHARQLEEPIAAAPAPRPAPCPPASARPRQLSVTEIRRLVRDPYAIYGKHVLRLRPLDPLMRAPDALLRGIVLHEVLEKFVSEIRDVESDCTKERLMEIAVSVLAENVPWAEARATWLARLERVADWFVSGELARRTLADPAAFEAKSRAELPDLGFALTATADRIDLDRNGNLHLYDYKTGSPPSRDQQTYYDKQLLLEAAMAERTGFGALAPATVVRAVYIGLGSGGKEVDAPLEAEPTDVIWSEFHDLIAKYLDDDTGFPARRAMESKRDRGDYDQLARFGEWDITDSPVKIKL
ncbi:double-strand break repair protein AddB [Roseovarius sp. CAU 1744]|uniref:double-strand break repair protein AddB n=1 Tax=Roseovarius sp. CAU 1744 TaxID=3140368 RepID=UPI00325C1BB2